MSKCLYCGHNFTTLKKGEDRILFCRKQCRRNYIRMIVDKVHELTHLQLKKLWEKVLTTGFLNNVLDESELQDIENENTVEY